MNNLITSQMSHAQEDQGRCCVVMPSKDETGLFQVAKKPNADCPLPHIVAMRVSAIGNCSLQHAVTHQMEMGR